MYEHLLNSQQRFRFTCFVLIFFIFNNVIINNNIEMKRLSMLQLAISDPSSYHLGLLVIRVLSFPAIAEPPTCLAVSVPLAIRNAVASARRDANPQADKWYMFGK